MWTGLPVEESVRMTEDRDRESTSMAWPTLGSRTAEEQNRTGLVVAAAYQPLLSAVLFISRQSSESLSVTKLDENSHQMDFTTSMQTRTLARTMSRTRSRTLKHYAFSAIAERVVLTLSLIDSVRNSEVCLRTGLAHVSGQIARGRNATFGHVARLPDNTPAHQAMLCQVEQSVGRPQTLYGNVPQVDHVPSGPTNSAAITTVFLLRLCGGKPLVAVTRERRYGPSRIRVNDDDDCALYQLLCICY